MFNTFKKFIPMRIKILVYALLYREDIFLPKAPKAFVFLSADYGNIGDLAISAAQGDFLESHLPGYMPVHIPISKTRVYLRSIKKQIRADDIVTIIGGGNLGVMYPDIEELRQLVIRSFPKNRIVCFPQTLDWENSKVSERALQQIVKVYSKHPDIHVFARESVTHSKLQQLFNAHKNVKIGLVPDIVMSATAKALGAEETVAPTGIIRCLRNDKESALSTEQYAALDSVIEKTGLEVTVTDTHAGGSSLSPSICAELLAEKLTQFRSAKLVVTDRLHGMILCLLSGTPCLVLPNSNHKIRQTWLDWLQEHPRIIFIEPTEFDEISDRINQLLVGTRGERNESPVDASKYNVLEKALKKK